MYPKVSTFSPSDGKDKAGMSVRNDANGVVSGQCILKHNGENNSPPAF